MEVILKVTQSYLVNQCVNVYYGLTQVILNQEHNVVKAAKNAIIEIEKNSELKESLGNKEQNNAFVDIRKLSKTTCKVNKIKIMQDTERAFRRSLQAFLYILHTNKHLHLY